MNEETLATLSGRPPSGAGNVESYFLSADVEGMPEIEAQALASEITQRATGFNDPDGAFLFGKPMDGRDRVKRLREVFSKGNADAAFDDELKTWMTLDDEGRAKHVKKMSLTAKGMFESLKAPFDRRPGDFGSSIFDTTSADVGIEHGSEEEKRFIAEQTAEAKRQQGLWDRDQVTEYEKKLMARQAIVQYGHIAKTLPPAALDAVRAAVNGDGVKPEELDLFDEPTKRQIASAVSALKATYSGNWPNAMALWQGTKDVAAGPFRYAYTAGYRATSAVLGGGQMLDAVDHEILTETAIRRANREKLPAPESFSEEAWRGVLQSLPYTLSMATGPTGILGTLSMVNQSTEDLLLSGVDPERAYIIGAGVGAVQALIERAQFENLFSGKLTELQMRQVGVRALQRAIARTDWAAAKRIAAEAGGIGLNDVARVTGGNWAEEVAQDLTQEAGLSIGLNDWDYKRTVNVFFDSIRDNFAPSFGFGLLGAGNTQARGAFKSPLSDGEIVESVKLHFNALRAANDVLNPVDGEKPGDQKTRAKGLLRQMFGEWSARATEMERSDYLQESGAPAEIGAFFRAYEAAIESTRKPADSDLDLSAESMSRAFPFATATEIDADTTALDFAVNAQNRRILVKRVTPGNMPANDATFGASVEQSLGEQPGWYAAQNEDTRKVLRARFSPTGSYAVTNADGTPLIDADGVMYLAGMEDSMAADLGARGPVANRATVYHEWFHAGIRMMNEAGILSEADVADMRSRFGDPRVAGELFDEETAAVEYARWRTQREEGNAPFGKIRSFFRRLAGSVSRSTNAVGLFHALETGNFPSAVSPEQRPRPVVGRPIRPAPQKVQETPTAPAATVTAPEDVQAPGVAAETPAVAVDNSHPYFTSTPTSIRVPVSKLVPSNIDTKNSVDNAVQYMGEAAEGKRPKRKPLTVVSNGADGTYTVLDGNATTQAIRILGQEDAIAEVVPLRQASSDVTELRAQGEAAAADMSFMLAELAELTGGWVKGPRVKSVDRMVKKIEEDPEGGAGYTAANLLDVVAGTIVLQSEADVAEALERMLSMGLILRVKNRFKTQDATGYRDVLLNVRIPGGMIGEIQLTTESMNWAKSEGVGHDAYKMLRSLGDRVKAGELSDSDAKRIEQQLNALMRQYYGFFVAEAGAESIPLDLAAAKAASRDTSSVLTKILEETSSGLGAPRDPSAYRPNATPPVNKYGASDSGLTRNITSPDNLGSITTLLTDSSTITQDLAPVKPEPTFIDLVDLGEYPVVEASVASIQVNQRIKQFKSDADPKTGVKHGDELAGEYKRVPIKPIILYRSQDGTLEVATGRHRLDLARRNGMTTIPAQVVNEADGWTPEMAALLDAYDNIRDEKGTVQDYARFFRESGIDEATARREGLLARIKGRSAWALAHGAANDLWAAAMAGPTSEGGIDTEQAAAIADAAPVDLDPRNEGIQLVALKQAIAGMKPGDLSIYVRTLKAMAAAGPQAVQGDLFGFDDTALNEAVAISKAVGRITAKLTEKRRILSAAALRGDALSLTPAKANQFGIGDLKDLAEINRALDETKIQLQAWENYYLDPALMVQAREAAGLDAPRMQVTEQDASRHADLETKHNAGTITAEETAEAQRMVDEAAKKAGYNIKGYHATNARFNRVDMKKGAMGSFWFAGDKDSIQAGTSGASGTKIIKDLYIKIHKPAGWTEYDKYSKAELQRDGYDGVILKDEDGTFNGFVWQKSSQIKSAEPFTGVRLDQRFNSQSNDIRFQIAPSDRLHLVRKSATLSSDESSSKTQEAVQTELGLFPAEALPDGMGTDWAARSADEQPGGILRSDTLTDQPYSLDNLPRGKREKAYIREMAADAIRSTFSRLSASTDLLSRAFRWNGNRLSIIDQDKVSDNLPLRETHPYAEPINSPRDAARLVWHLRSPDAPSVKVVSLDKDNRPIATNIIHTDTKTRGGPVTSESGYLFGMREIFGPAIRNGAASIVVSVNHPEGDSKPTAAEQKMYDQLSKAGELLGVKVHDLVVTSGTYSSVRQKTTREGFGPAPWEFLPREMATGIVTDTDGLLLARALRVAGGNEFSYLIATNSDEARRVTAIERVPYRPGDRGVEGMTEFINRTAQFAVRNGAENVFVALADGIDSADATRARLAGTLIEKLVHLFNGKLWIPVMDVLMPDAYGQQNSARYNTRTAGVWKVSEPHYELARLPGAAYRPWPTDFPSAIAATTGQSLQRAALKPGESLVPMKSDDPEASLVSPAYLAAKSGDDEAASDVIDTVMAGKDKDAKLTSLAQRHPDAILCPVLAVEASGHNKLPIKFAYHISERTGLETTLGIRQSAKVGHTGKGEDYRLMTPPTFQGPVEAGREYILVDDFVTLGGTMAELRAYIESNGGRVVEVFSLAVARFSQQFQIRPNTRLALQQRFGYAPLRELLQQYGIRGGNIDALTEREARSLLRSPDVEALRTRFADAGHEAVLGAQQEAVSGRPSGGRAAPRYQVADRNGAALAEWRALKTAAANAPSPRQAARLAVLERELGQLDLFDVPGNRTVDQVEREAEAKRQRDEVSRRSSAGMTGTTGDLGQGDLFGNADLFGTAPRAEVKQRLNPREDLIAAVAGRILRGQAPAEEMVAKAIDSLQIKDAAAGILTAANQLAKSARAGVKLNASDSALMRSLKDLQQRTQFLDAMEAEFTEGVGAGAEMTEAGQRVDSAMAEAARREILARNGFEATMLERAYRLDFVDIFERMPDKKPETDGVTQEEDDEPETTDSEPKPVPEAVIRAVDEIADLAKRQAIAEAAEQAKKAAEKAAEEAAGAAAAGSGEGDQAAAESVTVNEILDRMQVDISDPVMFRFFLQELVRRRMVELYANDGQFDADDPWSDPRALRDLALTAQNVINRVADALCPSFAREALKLRSLKLERYKTIVGLGHAIEFLAERLNAAKLHESRQQLVSSIEKNLKREGGARGKFTGAKEELKRKVEARVELWAREVKKAVRMTGDEVSERIAELDAKMGEDLNAEGDNKTIDQDAWMRERGALLAYGGLIERMPAEIADARDRIAAELAGSRARLEERAAEREMRTTMLANEYAAAVLDPRGAPAADPGRAEKWLSGYLSLVNRLRMFTRFAEPGNRVLATNVIGHIDLALALASSSESAGVREHQLEMRKALEDTYGRSARKTLADLRRHDPALDHLSRGGQKTRMSRDRVMQILVSVMQDDYAKNCALYGRDGAYIDELRTVLNPQDLAFVDWLRRWYDRNRTTLSEVQESVTGVPVLSPGRLYMPVKIQRPPHGFEESHRVWSPFLPSLTPRVRHNRDFDESAGITDLWASRMLEAEHYKAYAETGIEVRGILGRAVVQQEIARSHGKSELSELRAHLTDILTGGFKSEGKDAAIDAARSWTALTALSGNIGVGIKQTTGVFAFGFEIGIRDTARHMSTALTPEGLRTMATLIKSQPFQNRFREGAAEDIVNALKDDNPSRFKRIMQVGMINVRLGDAVASLVVAQGIYRDLVERYKNEGQSAEEAHAEAVAKTFAIVERTQQSSRSENLARMQRRGGSVGRAAFQFMSSQRQFLEYEFLAIQEYRAGAEGSGKRLARVLILNHLILPGVFGTAGLLIRMALGTEPKEDDVWRLAVSMILGPFAAVVVAGAVGEAALTAMVTGKAGWPRDMMPLSNVVRQGGMAGKVLSDMPEALFEFDFDQLLEDLDKFAGTVSAPYRDVRKLQKAYVD